MSVNVEALQLSRLEFLNLSFVLSGSLFHGSNA
jgi:hypothetical protein